jgi:hypothetical protein
VFGVDPQSLGDEIESHNGAVGAAGKFFVARSSSMSAELRTVIGVESAVRRFFEGAL